MELKDIPDIACLSWSWNVRCVGPGDMVRPNEWQLPTHLTCRRFTHTLQNPWDQLLQYTSGASAVGSLGCVRDHERIGQHHGDGKQPSWGQEHCVRAFWWTHTWYHTWGRYPGHTVAERWQAKLSLNMSRREKLSRKCQKLSDFVILSIIHVNNRS